MMLVMLPSNTEYGRRLAAVMPTVYTTVAQGRVSQAVVLVIDGLGWVNLKEYAAAAPQLCALRGKRITTVAPSTTAAAITTITTGTLPAEHGLLGYQILNPATDRITQTLKEWDEITDLRAWQRCHTFFERAEERGISCTVFARPAHQSSGFTRAVLSGASYHGAQTINERFAQLATALRQRHSGIYYLYVDELDKAGHSEGVGSQLWLKRLRQVDQAVADLLPALPSDCTLVLTADHGMINLGQHQHRYLEDLRILPENTRIAGEARHRHLYLPDPEAATAVAAELQRLEGGNCWVGTRKQWLATGVYGDFTAYPENANRVGDVVLVPRKRLAYLSHSNPGEAQLQGFHGGLDDDELGIPLLFAGKHLY